MKLLSIVAWVIHRVAKIIGHQLFERFSFSKRY